MLRIRHPWSDDTFYQVEMAVLAPCWHVATLCSEGDLRVDVVLGLVIADEAAGRRTTGHLRGSTSLR